MNIIFATESCIFPLKFGQQSSKREAMAITSGIHTVFSDITISDRLINNYKTGTHGNGIITEQVHQFINNAIPNFSLLKQVIFIPFKKQIFGKKKQRLTVSNTLTKVVFIFLPSFPPSFQNYALRISKQLQISLRKHCKTEVHYKTLVSTRSQGPENSGGLRSNPKLDMLNKAPGAFPLNHQLPQDCWVRVLTSHNGASQLSSKASCLCN